jgi:hypothetical protein
VPRSDPGYPDTPQPDPAFLDAVRRHLDPRRLLTTEVILTGPKYIPILVSIGFQPARTASEAEVRDRIRAAVRAFAGGGQPADDLTLLVVGRPPSAA